MKKIFLMLAILAASQLVTAQNSKKWSKRAETIASSWVLGAGFNTVNNSGAGFKELTNSDHWAFGKIPFYGSVETNFANKWRAKVTLSFNYFKDGKAFNGEILNGESDGGNDAGYAAFDLAAQYYFLKSKKYVPYLLAGMGLSHFGDYSTTQEPLIVIAPLTVVTLNAGFGINYWFSKTWGINAQVMGKWSLGVKNNNHSQASIGAIYKL
ncbi:hypothetical protein N9B77_00255 [Flavobacteriaceae bacterium]|nr:hypothetical protein [Flavobacteriaceae bacterium]